jgi:DNA-binding LytR/AlgR family response regulator
MIGQKKIISNQRLGKKTVEKELLSKPIIRVHRSYIINKKQK